MAKKSAGILIYRRIQHNIEVLLGHPGGPFWAKKDAGAWSIPKGEFDDNEDAMDAAIREVYEETGLQIVTSLVELTPVKIKSGKIIYAWATLEEVNIDNFISNHFTMEWPPHSGKQESFPEIDRVEWFDIDMARQKISVGQLPFLDQLEYLLRES